MTARKGVIIRNVFRNNNGEGGAVKISNLFNEDNLIMLNNNGDNDDESSLLISDCSFEMLNNNDCYLFYLRGNNGANVKLSKCKFTGILSDGRYYIKGKSASKEEEGPKLVVKSCIFESVFSKSFNMNNDFLSIDLKEQIFSLNEYDENKNKSSSYILIIVAVFSSFWSYCICICQKKKS